MDGPLEFVEFASKYVLKNNELPFIFQIIPGKAAAATGKLRMGDRILSVNGVDIRKASHQVTYSILNK